MASIVGDEIRGLPISDLVAGPLLAAADAQGKLANMTAEFIQRVGMSNGVVNTVQFKYHNKDSRGSNVENQLDVPLLSIVNVPNLAVKRAEVDFTMEVKQQCVDKDSKDMSGNLSASVGWGPFSMKMSGSVATKSEHTRSTDKSAKYDIKVEARDDGMPEGLARVLDMLAANIANPAHKA